MNGRYILVGGEPVAEPDLFRWAQWLERAPDRIVARTEIDGGGVVSTVFLGIDHAFGEGAPILFETMVFDGPLSDEQERYQTRQEAVAGHALMVARVRAAVGAK